MNPAVEYRSLNDWLNCDHPYVIGKDGSIWSKSNYVKYRPMKVHLSGKGKGAVVSLVIGGRNTNRMVAPLVLRAFGDPRPIGCEVFYRDGNGLNCAFSNLVWAPKGTCTLGRPSKGSTTIFYARTFHNNKGSNHYCAVLNEETVADARELYAEGQSVRSIARGLGISHSTMMDALSGKTWAHVPGGAPVRFANGRPRGTDNRCQAR